jgi:hypothetical protein
MKTQQVVRKIWTNLLAMPIIGFLFYAVSWALNGIAGWLDNVFGPLVSWLFFGLDGTSIFLQNTLGQFLIVVGWYSLPIVVGLVITDIIMQIHKTTKNRKEG